MLGVRRTPFVTSFEKREYNLKANRRAAVAQVSTNEHTQEMLPVRKCGNQGFKCAVQGLGCVGMSAYYKGYETDAAQEEALRVFDKAAQFQDFMLDTSNAYGPYTNEQLIHQATINRKGRFRIATKCGSAPVPGSVTLDSSPDHIKKSCQGSLERLGVDCIDLYYLHRYDQKTPIEETMGAFKELIDEGKIKYVGMSEVPIPTLRKAHAVCPITAYEMEWSLITRDVEEDLVPTCRELGIGIVTYSPLGRGFLTGSIKSKQDIPRGDWREKHPRLNEHFDHNVKLVKIVEEVAAAKGCTPGQVALAWIHAQGKDVFPIPGTKHVDRFEENVEAFHVKLTDDDMAKLNEIADKIRGTRQPAERMSVVYNSP